MQPGMKKGARLSEPPDGVPGVAGGDADGRCQPLAAAATSAAKSGASSFSMPSPSA